MQTLYWLPPDDPDAPFPDPESALREPDGLLAAGGDLSPRRLLDAYRTGIFPWYSEGEPILWWSPDPRAVLLPDELRVTRSLRRSLRNGGFEIRYDSDFAAVVAACAEPRGEQPGTWITAEMDAAYCELHRLGHAHSVEVWRDGQLVGGLYGLAIGRVFFGESMFSRVSDASKVATAHLCRRLVNWGYRLIDCQVMSPHLERLGASTMPRAAFTARITALTTAGGRPGSWRDVGGNCEREDGTA